MDTITTQNLTELDKRAMISTQGGWGGGGSWGSAYRSHEMSDFFRGVYDGLSSMWK
ncbi:MAG: hypothetical protein ACR2MM_05705 [Flavobacteriaceae bacterium]